MVDEKPMMEKFHDLERILNHFTLDWDTIVLEN